MKTYLAIFICLACLATQAQTADYSAFLKGTTKLASLQDLRALSHFDQQKLTAEQIDEKLDSLIRFSRAINNYYLEVPYNTKRLVYEGKKHLKDLLPFSADAFDTRLAFLNKPLEVYHYDSIYILLPDDSRQSLLHLFFTARALTIIRFKYPEAYTRLIKQRQIAQVHSFVAQDPFWRAPSFNDSKSFISYDTSPRDIAASASDKVFAQSTDLVVDGNGYFKNLVNLVVSIDSRTILGDTTVGSKLLYGFADPAQNYNYYMRDGLIESLIHEYTHQYICGYATVDRKAHFLNEMRFDGVDRQFSLDVEEAVVVNTVLAYYQAKGGISTTVTNFYTRQLQLKKSILTAFFGAKINLQRYYALKALTPPGAETFEAIYRLSVLD